MSALIESAFGALYWLDEVHALVECEPERITPDLYDKVVACVLWLDVALDDLCAQERTPQIRALLQEIAASQSLGALPRVFQDHADKQLRRLMAEMPRGRMQ